MKARLPALHSLGLLAFLSGCSPPRPESFGYDPDPPPAAAPMYSTRLEELIGMLHNVDGEYVENWVQAIDDLQKEADPSWLPELRRELVHGVDFVVREGVAPTVIKFDGLGALPLLLEAHRRGIEENHDNDGLDACIMDLVERDKKASLAAIRPFLQDKNPAFRSAAAWLMGFVAEEADVRDLLALVSDGDADVRSSVMGSLPSFPPIEESFQVLVRALDDPSEDVKLSAIYAMGYFEDQRAVPLLKERLPHASEGLTHALKSTLESLQKKKAASK